MKILLVALLAASVLMPGCEKKKEAPAMRPVNVGVALAEKKDAPLTVAGVGHVMAMKTVAVQPQVTGKLDSMPFTEGSLVREGQLLAVIDEAPFEAKVNEARSALNRDWAKAAQAGRDYLRFKELIRQEVVSQEEYEKYRTDFETGWQQVKADQAALETAIINLKYCRIYSPVTGVVGYQQVKPGNTVSAYQTTLVTVNQIRPVLVRFSVSEGDLAIVRRYYGKEAIPAAAKLPKEEQDVKEKGFLTAIDNAIDQQTGMISLQAQFENESLSLWPGQFVNVTSTLAVDKDQTVIPSDAVMTRQDGSFVFVVSKDLKAELRRVKTGRAAGRKEVVILEGVEPGETVITDGVIRVAPGGAVNPAGAEGRQSAAPVSSGGQNAKPAQPQAAPAAKPASEAKAGAGQ